MEFEKFAHFLDTFRSFQALVQYFLKNSNVRQMSIIETYGFSFIKFRISKQNHSLGYMVSILENYKRDGSREAEQIEEYQAQETSLEVIFQYFASQKPSERKKGIVEQQ